MKILSIGNSFSEDAQRYLAKIAKSDNYAMKTVNLMIGGCSLRTHYINALENNKAYDLQFGGTSTGFRVSIKEALINDEWDVVTLQQVSYLSPKFDTYEPYLSYMVEYVKKYCPKTKIYIHQTWAYEENSKLLCEDMKYDHAEDMLNDIVSATNKACLKISADGIIPSGEMLMKLLNNGIKSVHRDALHTTLGLGRYALGLLWYHILTGNSVKNISFSDFDENVSENEILIGKNVVEQMKGHKK